MVASLGARSATCRTARPSEILIFSPANIASDAFLQARLLGQLDQQAQRLVGDAVFRIIEIDADILHSQPFAARGVFGEELAQMGALDLLIVLAEGDPCREVTQRGGGHPKPLYVEESRAPRRTAGRDGV